MCFVFAASVVAFGTKNLSRLSAQEFLKSAKMDTASYFCEAFNNAGPPQRCKAVKMEVRKCSSLSFQQLQWYKCIVFIQQLPASVCGLNALKGH